MKITFLGTGSMIPTKERNHFAILLSYKNENILVDCGEGTQRQFKLANISPTKITKILITHWHGDHTFGLHGLILTLGASNYSKTLEIYGPKGIKKSIKDLIKVFNFQTGIKMNVTEIDKKKFFENEDFYLEALPLDHGISCLGYSFTEKDKLKINLKYLKKYNLKQHPIIKNLQKGKDIIWKGKKISAKKATIPVKGKKLTIITDTSITPNATKLAKNSDLLICESTHLHELKEKTEKFKHLTSLQAAQIAKKSKSQKLVLTHFSQRYKYVKPLIKEAKTIFKNTTEAKDLMTLNL